MFDHGIKILIIIVVTFIITKISRTVIDKVVRRIVVREPNGSAKAEQKREDTLINIFSGTVKVIAYLAAVLMIISEFGIDIAPLIAGAGIVGVAVGFGGQYLVRDLITGVFLMLENQYRVGDIVDIAGKGGVVEDITLRVTVLRDLDGVIHHIPHGEVTTVSNKSKGFSQVNVNIGVAYEADIQKVQDVINRVGEELFNDENFKDKMREAPYFLRVDDLGDSAVVVKIIGKVEAGEQWGIAGEIRRRVKLAFDAEGIEIPFPQVVVSQKKDTQKDA